MDTEYKLLINKLTPLLAFLAIVILGAIYILKDTISFKIKEWKKKRKIENLVYHDVFITAENVRSKVMAIRFITHGEKDNMKTKLLHKLIDLKIDAVTINFREFLKDKKLNTINGQQLKFEVSAMLSSLVNEYNDKAFKIFTTQEGIEANDAKFVIDSYEKFRQDIVEGFTDRLESITTNDDYGTNYDRMSAILEVVAISLFIIPKDAKNAFDLINGKISKYNK